MLNYRSLLSINARGSVSSDFYPSKERIYSKERVSVTTPLSRWRREMGDTVALRRTEEAAQMVVAVVEKGCYRAVVIYT